MTPPPPPPRPKPPISVNTTNHGTSPMQPSRSAGSGSSGGNISDDGWQQVGTKARKQGNQQLSGAPKGPAKKTPLTGAGPKPKTTDLYVLNISRCDSDRMIDIANRVREHCKANDIRVTFVRVFPRKYSLESVNVKISVVLDDVDRALGIHIWPDNVSCRRWNKDPPQRNSNDNNNGGGRGDGHQGTWNSQEGQGSRGRRMSRSRSRGRGRSASSVRFSERRDSYSNDDQYYDAWNDTYRALNGFGR